MSGGEAGVDRPTCAFEPLATSFALRLRKSLQEALRGEDYHGWGKEVSQGSHAYPRGKRVISS
jgi:hypothetical protein